MIGKIRYTQARGVMVREPGDITNVHSAVSGSVNVYVDTLTESRAVIAAWDEIIAAANEKVVEILARALTEE